MPSPEFVKLQKAAEMQVITIGLDRATANTFCTTQSSLHGLLNYIVLIPFVLAIVFFFTAGWQSAGISLLAGFLGVRWIQNSACTIVRRQLLEDEQLFDEFYSSGVANIRVNASNEDINRLRDWRGIIADI